MMQISLLVKAKAKVNYERPLVDSGSWRPTTPLLMAVQVNAEAHVNVCTDVDIHGMTQSGA